MARKKIDNRLRVLIENGVASSHRSMFVIVGDKAKEQIVVLHHLLTKSRVKARPSVLWCYKKELGFSSHRQKKMKKLQKKISKCQLDVNQDDPFELFVASTDIRYVRNFQHNDPCTPEGILILPTHVLNQSNY